MKISKSKQELARIINKNGGWRDGAEFAWFQGKLKGGPCHEVWFGEENSEPEYVPASGSFHSYWSMVVGKFPATKFDNWHQTILSSAEYFHLYPAPDAKPEYCESVMRSIPEPSDKPTIEQLAADYRAKLAIAQQAQEEADSRRDEAEAALEKLYQAGLLIGLDIAIANDESEAQEDEPLNITDWRDLQVGDEVEITSVFSRGRNEGYEHLIGETATVRFVGDPSTQSLEVSHNSVARYIDGFKFIRRP